jgi:hypothetical protein
VVRGLLLPRVRGLLLPRVRGLLLEAGLLVGRLLLAVRGLLLVGRLFGVAQGLPRRGGLGLGGPVGRVRADRLPGLRAVGRPLLTGGSILCHRGWERGYRLRELTRRGTVSGHLGVLDRPALGGLSVLGRLAVERVPTVAESAGELKPRRNLLLPARGGVALVVVTVVVVSLVDVSLLAVPLLAVSLVANGAVLVASDA